MKKANFISHLNKELACILNEVETSDYWAKFISTETSDELRLETMKWIMREIWTYQIEVNRAVFTAVGRLGTNVEEQGLIRSMISVQIEEVGHGTLALNDFLKLGGTSEEAQEIPSPPALALISVVRHLGENYHPLCHLGYMYFFEMFTVMITELVSPYLENSNYPNESLKFMRLHAMEDERHSDMLSEVIEEVLDKYEDAEKHIKYGFDCFREIYPHNLWKYALGRAEALEYA
jgi:hypothetical protein